MVSIYSLITLATRDMKSAKSLLMVVGEFTDAVVFQAHQAQV